MGGRGRFSRVGGVAVAVRRVMTSRRGGVSKPPYATFNLGPGSGDDPAAVAANRERLRRELELDAIAWMSQWHSADVAVLDAVPDAPPRCDALVTATPGVAL